MRFTCAPSALLHIIVKMEMIDKRDWVAVCPEAAASSKNFTFCQILTATHCAPETQETAACKLKMIFCCFLSFYFTCIILMFQQNSTETLTNATYANFMYLNVLGDMQCSHNTPRFSYHSNALVHNNKFETAKYRVCVK